MSMTTAPKTMELIVPDLCCVECSQGVVATLRQAPGVQEFQVLGMSEKVRVTYDETTTKPEMLAQTIKEAGHEVIGWKGEDRAAPPLTPKTEAHTRRVQTFALLRLAFVGVISLIVLVEIAGESLGLLHGVEELVPAPLALAVVLLGGFPIFRGAWNGVRQRRINTDAVMSVGILAAAAIGQFISSALIVFFGIIAHYLEDKTTGRARRAIAELAELAPKTARVKRGANIEEIPVSIVERGDLVVVRQGEQIPIDGTLTSGHATVNQAPITGESLPPLYNRAIWKSWSSGWERKPCWGASFTW